MNNGSLWNAEKCNVCIHNTFWTKGFESKNESNQSQWFINAYCSMLKLLTGIEIWIQMYRKLTCKKWLMSRHCEDENLCHSVRTAADNYDGTDTAATLSSVTLLFVK